MVQIWSPIETCFIRSLGCALAGFYGHYSSRDLHNVMVTRWSSGKRNWLGKQAGTYAKRLIDKGCDTVHGLCELDTEDLVGAGMRKGDAKLLMGRVSQKCTSSGGEDSSGNGEGSMAGLANGTGSLRDTTRCRWRRRTRLLRPRQVPWARGCRECDQSYA